MSGSDTLFSNVIAGDQNLPENYQAFINKIHTDDGINKVIDNYIAAVGVIPAPLPGMPDRKVLPSPSKVFKAFPVISNEAEVLPPPPPGKQKK